jgi:hypothetical protein
MLDGTIWNTPHFSFNPTVNFLTLPPPPTTCLSRHKKNKISSQKSPLSTIHYILTQHWISTGLVLVSDARMTPEL